jgi:hypothetical protein
LDYPEDEQPCSRIDTIIMEGDSAERFRPALGTVMKAAGDGGAAGRCLGSQGLQILLARVQADIIARGYTTTRVLAQPQDLSAGRLVLTVLPGRLRKVRMAEGADARGNTFSALPLSEEMSSTCGPSSRDWKTSSASHGRGRHRDHALRRSRCASRRQRSGSAVPTGLSVPLLGLTGRWRRPHHRPPSGRRDGGV